MALIGASALQLAVDSCYEAALDPSLWPAVLASLSKASGSTGAVVFLFGELDRASYLASDGCAESMDIYLASEWCTKNPRLQIPPPSHGTQSDADVERDERRAGINAAFRDDFLRKHDMGWFAGASLFRSEDRQVLISVERRFSCGAFESDELQLLEAAFQRMRHAMSFVPRLDARLRTALIDGFELRSQAAAIVAYNGAILHLNAAAKRLIPAVLRMRHNRLHATDARYERAWAAFLEQLTATMRPSDRACDPVLLTSSEGEQILARGLPLPRNANDLFSQAGALILFEPLAPRPPSIAMLRSLFGLTHAEALLASELAVRCDLVRAARALGIGHETARSHLKAIFLKTGSANQIECVAKLSKIR